MPEDTLHIEPAVRLTDLVTFHSEADSALMQVQSSSEMVLRPIGTTPLGENVAWIFGVCVCVCVLIGLARFLSDSYLTKIISYIFVPTRNRGGVYTDMFLHYFPVTVVMSVVYLLSMSLVVLEALVVFGYISQASFIYYLYTLLAVLAYTVAKYILHTIILSSFGLSVAQENLIRHKVLASNVESLLFLPISVIVPFLSIHNGELMFMVVALVVVLLAIWRAFRAIEDISLDLLSFVNIFLYLCAVEIAPMMCILKALGVI